MIAWLVAAAASAATRTVTTSGDTVNAGDGVLSLREAMAASAAGDTIVFGFATRTTIALDAARGPLPTVGAYTITGADLVTVDAVNLATGVPLVLGTGAIVRGVGVTRAPDACVELTGSGALFEDNAVWSCAQAGIRIPFGATGAQVLGNAVGVDPTGAVAGACQTPTGACGGIDLRSSGAGIDLRDNFVAGTRGAPGSSQGNGILVLRANGAEIVGNVVGATPAGVFGSNLGNGISVTPSSGATAVAVLVEDNTVVASGVVGISLAARSDGATVRGNRVGVTAGAVVSGNGGNGIKVFGSDDHVIEQNVVVASGSTGILLQGSTAGDWQSGSTVAENWVGVYPLLGGGFGYAGNAGNGIRTEGSEPGGALLDNVVAANTSNGLVAAAPEVVLRGNRVGLSPDGLSAHGNGAAGILVTNAAPDTVVGGELAESNVVAASATTGIEVRGDRARVRGNFVGTNGAGSGASATFGNGADGIWVVRADGVTVGPGNVVVRSGDVGIEVSDASSGNHVEDLEVFTNKVGVDLTGASRPNGTGVRMVKAGVRDARLWNNEIAGNAGTGVRLDARTNVELSRNRIHDNGACGIRLVNAANDAGPAAIPPAVLTVAWPAGLTGTVASFGTATLVRIEVYADAGTEHERYLGDAIFEPDPAGGYRWSLTNDGVILPDATVERVSALATWAFVGVGGGFEGTRTSGPGSVCGDGCAAVGAGACVTGDLCHAWTCAASDVCVEGAGLTGAACLDGDPCTASDTCAAGVCGGTPVASCDACFDVRAGVGVLRDLSCDDGDPCTVDACSGGSCTAPDPVGACDDGNDCTADLCEAGVGCAHPAQAAGFTCEDGDLCTGQGVCDGDGLCSSGPELGCPNERCNDTRGVQWACDPTAGCVVAAGAGACDGFCDLWDLCPYAGDACDDAPGCDGCPSDCPLGDVDLDGIPDDWELEVPTVDLDCDGAVSPAEVAALQDIGLVAGVEDVLVELDWMGPPVPGGHDHALEETGGGLDAVTQAFDDQELFSGRSLRLYVDQDDELPHRRVTTFSRAPFSPGCADWASLDAIKRDPARFEPWRLGLFHYGISGHQRTDCEVKSSGLSELGGDDFILALRDVPDWDNVYSRRGTFLHELSHNFDLRHGGVGDDPWTSNYPSVMSYRFQLLGGPVLPGATESTVDLSHQPLADLDEAALVEFTPGTSIVGYEPAEGPPYLVVFDDPAGGPVSFDPAQSGIDWNRNQILAGVVAVDLDGDGAYHVQRGRDDWAELALRFRCGPDGGWLGGRTAAAERADELVPEDALARHELHVPWEVEVDLFPACAANPVPATGANKRVQAVIWSTTTFDATATVPASRRLRGASPTHTAVSDVDDDGLPDLVLQFDAAALDHRGVGATLDFRAWMPDSRAVRAEDAVTWTSTTDGDADGVPTACDLCPTVAATPPSADGCP